MLNAAEKLDLLELGTRYAHYMELKEAFLLGIDTVDRMRPNLRSTADEEIKKRLQITVDTIERRLSYLSGFGAAEHCGSDLDRTLHAIEVQRQTEKKLLKGADDPTKDARLSRFEENPNT
jgi:hypothetical protein